MKIDVTEKKIAVVGIGGVGGYLAGMMARVLPHVTVVARGERGESIRQNGLVLHSGYHGEIVARPESVISDASELSDPDYIFICVKNYSLEEVCRQLCDVVTDDTVLIPVMNGVDKAKRLRSLLGKGTVVDSLIYTVSFSNADYSITQQGDFTNMRIGISHASHLEAEKVQEVADVLEAADVDCEVAEDIEREVWRKYMLNCAYNVMTSYYECTIGDIQDDPQKVQEYRQLAQEAYHVAVAEGVSVLPEHVEVIMENFHSLSKSATSSLQRDIGAGKQSELETFSGYIVREGERLGVDIRLSRKMYEGLKKKSNSGMHKTR